jgi:hypothetical protein
MRLFGRRKRGSGDDGIADELLELMRTIDRKGFERAAAERERIQAIGRRLDEEGGMDRMRAIHGLVRVKDSSWARYLEREWGGIGMWLG